MISQGVRATLREKKLAARENAQVQIAHLVLGWDGNDPVAFADRLLGVMDA